MFGIILDSPPLRPTHVGYSPEPQTPHNFENSVTVPLGSPPETLKLQDPPRRVFAAFHQKSIRPLSDFERSAAAALGASIEILEAQDQSRKPSSSLRGRVIFPGTQRNQSSSTSDLAQEIKNGNLSPKLLKFLIDKMWSASEIARLVDAELSAKFEETLLEQAIDRQSKTILQLFDGDSLKRFQGDIQRKIQNCQTLLSLIPCGNEPEFKEAPLEIGEISFLSSDERRTIRSLYFPEGISQLNSSLRSWLNREGVPKENLDKLASYQGETLVQEIIYLAIKLELFTVLQALPASAANAINRQGKKSICSKEHTLRTIQIILIEKTFPCWAVQ